MIAVEDLDERLSAFRLREPKAVEAMAASLGRYGQLSPLAVFDDGDRGRGEGARHGFEPGPCFVKEITIWSFRTSRLS